MRAMIAVLAAAALAGCASLPVYEGGRTWSEGWREGKVEKVGTASELGYRASSDCRYRDGAGGREALGRFAVIALQEAGRHRHHVAPVGPSSEPRIGDDVLVNPRATASRPWRVQAADRLADAAKATGTQAETIRY